MISNTSKHFHKSESQSKTTLTDNSQKSFFENPNLAIDNLEVKYEGLSSSLVTHRNVKEATSEALLSLVNTRIQVRNAK